MSHIGPAIECSPSAIPTPAVFGAEILSLEASWVRNFTLDVPGNFNYNHGAQSVQNVDFCNVTVTYSHPGYDDRITVETWLPRHWNQRLQATGGGGWRAGRFVLSQFFMGGAIGEGYATTTTDAGLGDTMPDAWALKSTGNVNLEYLHNLGYRSLNDEAIIAKDLVRSFYGIPPAYSYWSGCSQGGRQGLMLAQRYPHAYDGIVASAPAQSWPEFVTAVYYPLLAPLWAGEPSPLSCELEFLTAEAVKHCDSQDGIVDGIISDPNNCDFDPFSAVNKTFSCTATGKPMRLTRAAAITAKAAWTGPRTVAGDFLWYGVNPGSDITGLGVAPGQNLTTSPDEWLSLFLVKNQSFDATQLSHEEYGTLFHFSVKEYTDVMAANDPDLTAFKKAGGKLLTYHGMADESIPTKRTEHYYRAVSQLIPDVQDFYRYFESPGLAHCAGGRGGQPTTAFDALRKWVENGTAPEFLPVRVNGTDGEHNRILCPYPTKPIQQGGNASGVGSFRCVH
ncbi:hypothetical protein CNMCM8812_005171 [Aspergillus fumigatus]|nr:hypothetical protein CNMCM8812_005171 [Aspergillus fumigatus]KAH1518481.1 hypothetical protein KXX29_007435 [Aspergillus fumigatus]KAH1598632.1 hypothetical protein KXX44_005505 [Aspergillus fumigatus]KAH1637014.1 hypothetical protein KXX39_006956 [Aspergillus fumigatus]KAH2186717.1 hypothetical protein KXW61_008214 [Aspergillus fumigatus]